MSDKIRTVSFGQFDGGKGTAASRKPKAKKPAASNTARDTSPAPSGPSAEDKLRQAAKDLRRKTLQAPGKAGGMGKQRNQGAPGSGER